MKVSVLIATRNRAGVLARCLGEYAKQTYPDIELLVAINGSSDNTAEMLRTQFPHIRVLEFATNIGPLALNALAQEATGELLWRTDDDAYPALDTTIADAVHVMKSYPDIVAVTGEVYEATIDYELLNYYTWPIPPGDMPPDGYPIPGFCGAVAMLRKEAFLRAGGFWDGFYYEEEEVSIRMLMLGGRMSYVPTIRVVHLNAFSTERDTKSRWRLQMIQALRLQWKYWPWFVAMYRSSVIMLAMVPSAIVHHIRPSEFLEAMRKAIKASKETRRYARVSIEHQTLRRILMKRSIWHRMFHPYWKRLQGRFKA